MTYIWLISKSPSSVVFLTYLPLTFLDINLVPKDDKGEVFGVMWRCLDEKFVPPTIQRLKRLGTVNIINEHTAVCPSVVSHSKRLKTLLARRVPKLPETMNTIDSFHRPFDTYLHGNQTVVYHHLLCQAVNDVTDTRNAFGQ